MSKVLQCNICPTNGFNIQVFTVLSFFNKYFVSRVLHMQDKLLVMQTKTSRDVKIFCFPLIPKSKINIFTLKIYILEFSLSGTYHNVIFILEQSKNLFKIRVNVDFNHVFYIVQIWFIGNYSTTRNCAIYKKFSNIHDEMIVKQYQWSQTEFFFDCLSKTWKTLSTNGHKDKQNKYLPQKLLFLETVL